MASASTSLGNSASVSIDASVSGSTIYGTATLNNGYKAWNVNSSPTLKVYIDGTEVASKVIKSMGINGSSYVWFQTESVGGSKSVSNGNHTVTASWESPGGYVASSGSASVTVNVNYNPTPSYTTYTITLNDNGGSGGPGSFTIRSDYSSVTIPTSKPSRTDYDFVGWNTKSDGTGTMYYPGGTWSSKSNTTLYAIWKYNVVTYTINLNANGGSPNYSFTITSKQSSVTIPTSKPTRKEYEFLGWNTKLDGTGAWYYPGGTWSTKSNTTLYAIWKYRGGLVRLHNGSNFSAYRAYVFKNGKWVRADAYVRVIGSWRKGKEL